MSLKQTILEQLSAAMKSKDAVRTDTLRMLKAAVKNREIELRTELQDEQIIGVVRTQVKQHRDSIRQYEEGGRDDLAEKEKQELGILMSFMPEPLSEEAVTQAVVRIIEDLGATGMQDMGRVMKAAMAELANAADGKVVNGIVRKELSR